MSRSTHNANYLYDVDGETVWEKLRVIRGFLREKELALAETLLGMQENKEKMRNADQNSFEYKKYILRGPTMDGLIQETESEIKFLKQYETYLSEEAEKTRIPGKTDEEMYEINYFDELKIRLVRRAQMQYISTGCVEPDTLLRISKNKPALELAISTGLLNPSVLGLIDTLPVLEHNIPLLENKND
jgi:hypothetical protein